MKALLLTQVLVMLLSGALKVARAGEAGGFLAINGERFDMTHAYAVLRPDGFVPD